MRRVAAILGGAALAAVIVWGLVPPSVDPDAHLAAAEGDLRARFDAWRQRVERASERLAALATETPAGAEEETPFAAAERIVAEEGVDGVAVVDRDDVARFWAGRTFDADPELDFFGVQPGVEVVRILDLPAHRVLFAARAAGDAIAVAFLAFDERFPRRRNLADGLARRHDLERVRLRFGRRTVPTVPPEGAGRPTRTAVIDGLVHATLVAKTPDQLEEEAGALRRRARDVALLLVTAWLAVVLARRLRPHLGPYARAFEAVFWLVLLRVLVAWSFDQPYWGPPLASALTAVAAFGGAVVLARTSRKAWGGRRDAFLGGALTLGFLFLPLLYYGLIERTCDRHDGILLFDPLRVLPDFDAGVLLGSVGLVTVACFLLAVAASRWCGRTHRYAALLPFLALSVSFSPWPGRWLALGCVLAAINLSRAATRAEKLAGMTILAAIVSFPLLSKAHRAVFVRAAEQRTGELVQRRQRADASRILARAVDAVTDPAERVDREVAQNLAERRGLQHLAFRLWSQSEWAPEVPCAVQVWDNDGQLVSAFDFDSPPLLWLPERGDAPREGDLLLYGQEAGEAIRFYAREFPLRTIGDERQVGTARFSVPDRWDVLLRSAQRPSLFTVPLDLGLASFAPPVLLAELAPDGRPLRTSTGTTADIERPPAELLRRAHAEGHASARITYRGRPARLILGAARYSFGAVVFEEGLLQQDGFVFAKVLLTYSVACIAGLLALLIARRGRVTLLFRHRVALVLVLLSVPPVLLMAVNNNQDARQRFREEMDERLQRRLDLGETLLRERHEPVDHAWCMRLAASHLVDLNVYRGQELLATSRPGLWDTGLIGRRLDARAYRALVVEGGDDYVGHEYFGHAATLRAAYRKVRLGWEGGPIILAAPALEDPRALEREATASNALLLAIYLMTATVTVFAALLLSRSLTRPVVVLQGATSRVAAGELDATLPEKRQDEFGHLIRDFNRMTRELQGAQELRVRAERAAAWQEMARQVAHEIKNPLTPLKLTIQNLLAAWEEGGAEAFDEEFRRGAQLMLGQIDALHRIAGAFSAYAAFPVKDPQPVDVNGIVAEVAGLYGAGDGSVVRAAPAPRPLVVQADHDELQRALINLVTNARQAGARSVTLETAAVGSRARLDVRDDGAGIPEHVRDRIFEPSFTTKTSGTGLGLAIVRRIVKDYGGDIEIDSAPGRGTCVTLWLPLSPAEAP